jgi:hypothetical protein
MFTFEYLMFSGITGFSVPKNVFLAAAERIVAANKVPISRTIKGECREVYP